MTPFSHGDGRAVARHGSFWPAGGVSAIERHRAAGDEAISAEGSVTAGNRASVRTRETCPQRLKPY